MPKYGNPNCSSFLYLTEREFKLDAGNIRAIFFHRKGDIPELKVTDIVSKVCLVERGRYRLTG
jgi:hypothetical protein